MLLTKDDGVTRRIRAILDRINWAVENDLYYYNQPISELHGGRECWSKVGNEHVSHHIVIWD